VKVTFWPHTDGFASDTTVVVVAAWFTTWLSVALALVAKSVSPLYVATSGCVPTARLLVVNVAVVTPAVVDTVPVPMLVPPSVNVTVPLGVPAPGAVIATVAVNVTLWPHTDAFTLDASVVVVAAWFTTCVMAALVLVL
jgi:hypothetical protein